jgi:hypothetical protein
VCGLQVPNSTNALSIAEVPCLPVRGNENNMDGGFDDIAITLALEESSEALSVGERFLMFRRIVVPSSSESSNPSLHNLPVEEQESATFLNVGYRSSNDAESHPGRYECTTTPL